MDLVGVDDIIARLILLLYLLQDIIATVNLSSSLFGLEATYLKFYEV